MGQSLVKNYVHIIFSTKHRERFIKEEIEDKLYDYIGSVCVALGCQPLKIGGYDDHVHILCMLSKTITLSSLLEKIKSHSSKWFKTIDKSLERFYWQNGYGAFSVNPSQVNTVIKYISNQRAYHNHISFQDEFRTFLKKYEVEYNEIYVWD